MDEKIIIARKTGDAMKVLAATKALDERTRGTPGQIALAIEIVMSMTRRRAAVKSADVGPGATFGVAA